MRILFYGDSITDANRNREKENVPAAYGFGYPFLITAALNGRHPLEHEYINRGIGGNRIVDLYARVKIDAWNLKPDMISILIGVNDVWHEIMKSNGVDLERFEKVYRMLIEDTKKELPDVKLVIMEPFVLHGTATDEHYKEFLKVKKYAKVAKKIAKDYKCVFVPLQKDLDEAAAKYGADYCLRDGVHPAMGGAYIIADKWLKTVFGESL